MPFTGFKWGWIWLLTLYLPAASEQIPPAIDVAHPERSAPDKVLAPEKLDHRRLDTVNLTDYPFLSLESDSLINTASLIPFFQKLDSLRLGQKRQLNIVHIGDSHIQADWWTGYLRIRLQEQFGAAGRGLIFPYTLAGTNSPTDIRAGSNQAWEYRRTTFQQKHIPIGIAGMSIQTSGTQVWLDVQIRNDTLIDYAFDRVKLFSVSGEGNLNWSFGQFKASEAVAVAPPPKIYHTVRSGDTLYGLALRHGTSVRRIQQWNNLSGTMIQPGQKLIVGNGRSTPTTYDRERFETTHLLQWEDGPAQSQFATVQLDSLTHRLLMCGRKTGDLPGFTRIYGLSLENSRQNGLLYHAIGVNGVTYFHYNEATEFWQQLPYLQPDLIIVSLGTNETATPNFRPAGFYEQVQRFALQLDRLPENTAVILTTPPDALRRRRYDNPAIALAGEVIAEVAAAHDYALWDLYRVMGGAGSIKQWRSAQLTARDYLHFTKSGYAMQGELLFRAIMRAYEES